MQSGSKTARQTDLRQSEIKNLGVTTLGDEDVCRLDVAVDDSLYMGGVERVRDLDGKRENLFRFHRTLADPMLQRHSIQKLHGDKRLPVLIVNFRRLCRCWGGSERKPPSPRAETTEGLDIMRDIVRKELQSYEPTKFDILGLVYDTHSATAESFDNSVMGDSLADDLIGAESYVEETRQVNEDKPVQRNMKRQLAQKLRSSSDQFRTLQI